MVIKSNFWNVGAKGDKVLKMEDLGWPEVLIQDAHSNYSEYIFRYVIEVVGFNLLFYWIKDEQFYVIETEKDPIQVRRINPNPNWDGQCEFFKAGSDDGPNTSSPGEVIANFDNAADIWSELRIEGIPIGEVIDQSVIITWD